MKRFFLLLILICFFQQSFSIDKDLIIKKEESFNINSIQNYSITDLIILRSSVYAQKGFKFESNWLNNFFLKYKWYGTVNNFSFSLLDKTDWKKIKAIDKLIEDKIILSIRNNKNYKYFKEIDPYNYSKNKSLLKDLQIKYYLELKKIQFSDDFINKISSYGKQASGSSNTWLPLFSNITPEKEVTRTELEKLFEPFFNYFSVYYKDNKFMAVIFDTTCGGECSYPVVYFDDNGKILYVENKILFSSYQWTYVYDKNDLCAIVLIKTFPNESGTDLESSMQIFIQ